MHCGYCGIKDSKTLEKNPENLTESTIDLQIANLIYTSCSHSPHEILTPLDNHFTQLKEIKKLIHIQQQSLQNLEGYYEEQKRQLLDAVSHYISNNDHNIYIKEIVIKKFDSNFRKLEEISIETKYQQRVQKNLLNYFDKQELDKWTTKCEKTVAKIQKKLSAIKGEFNDQAIDKIYNEEISKISPLILPNKIKLDLHDMNFLVIESRQNENLEADNAKIKALKNFYIETHKNNIQYIIALHDVVQKSLGIYKKKFQHTKVLLNDIITNFRTDIKVIDVFSDFERVFNECLGELTNRDNFKYIYKRILDILNELTNQENERRLKFLKKFSSKIPYQIFPHLKGLCKQVNLKRFYENFEEDYVTDVDIDSDVFKKLQEIEKNILQL